MSHETSQHVYIYIIKSTYPYISLDTCQYIPIIPYINALFFIVSWLVLSRAWYPTRHPKSSPKKCRGRRHHEPGGYGSKGRHSQQLTHSLAVIFRGSFLWRCHKDGFHIQVWGIPILWPKFGWFIMDNSINMNDFMGNPGTPAFRTRPYFGWLRCTNPSNSHEEVIT